MLIKGLDGRALELKSGMVGCRRHQLSRMQVPLLGYLCCAFTFPRPAASQGFIQPS